MLKPLRRARRRSPLALVRDPPHGLLYEAHMADP